MARAEPAGCEGVEGKAQTMSETESQPTQVQMRIDRLYLKDCSFESPGTPAIFSEKFRPETQVDINTRVNTTSWR